MQEVQLKRTGLKKARCKVKITCFNKVQWKNNDDITTSDDHYMIFSSNLVTHTNGVGIIITAEIKKTLMERNSVFE